MQNTVLVLLATGGLVFSILSILEKYVKWILSFCEIFGQGCRKTLKFHLFGIPASWYGAAYYIVFFFLIFQMEYGVYWFIMIGFGIELTFIWIMVYNIRAFCLFCTLNAVMMAGLFLYVFDINRMWESLSIILISFITSLFFFQRENISEFSDTVEAEPEPEEDDDIAAVINGDVITLEEVEEPLSQDLYRLRSQIYQLSKNKLDELIRELLIKKQAKAEGKSEEELIETIVKDTDDKAGENQKQEKINKYADSLKEKFHVEVFLQKPSPPVKDDPAQGPPDASVAVVEFSDYLCPACRKGHDISKTIKKKYGDQIRWIFKDFPLKQHKGSDKMAEAAHCADDQDRFWQYQDLMFSSEGPADLQQLEKYAEDLDLDTDTFRHCMETHKHRRKVEKNIKSGKDAGISATPTFIINGQKISGSLPVEKFEELIEESLRNAK